MLLSGPYTPPLGHAIVLHLYFCKFSHRSGQEWDTLDGSYVFQVSSYLPHKYLKTLSGSVPHHPEECWLLSFGCFVSVRFGHMFVCSHSDTVWQQAEDSLNLDTKMRMKSVIWTQPEMSVKRRCNRKLSWITQCSGTSKKKPLSPRLSMGPSWTYWVKVYIS